VYQAVFIGGIVAENLLARRESSFTPLETAMNFFSIASKEWDPGRFERALTL
jgi:hypothetical protein